MGLSHENNLLQSKAKYQNNHSQSLIWKSFELSLSLPLLFFPHFLFCAILFCFSIPFAAAAAAPSLLPSIQFLSPFTGLFYGCNFQAALVWYKATNPI